MDLMRSVSWTNQRKNFIIIFLLPWFDLNQTELAMNLKLTKTFLSIKMQVYSLSLFISMAALFVFLLTLLIRSMQIEVESRVNFN